MARTAIQPEPAAFSRREWLSFCGAVPVVLLTGCGRTLPIPPPGADGAALRMNELKNSFTRVARRERNLPGVRSLAQMQDPTEAMPVADRTLLAAALYLDVREQLARTTRPIRESEVRAVLAQPIDTSGFNRQFVVSRLEETRVRLNADPPFARYIHLYESDPWQAHCEDIVTGETVPCYRWHYHVLFVPRWIDQWGP